jgi:hypothetical protein
MGMLVFYAGNFLMWCFVLFVGVFGRNGCYAWWFCGVEVVDWVGKMVCGRTVFGWGFFCSFLGFIFRRGRHIPQRLKPLFSLFAGRPKAEALGYLEARARAKADPLRG